MNKHLVVTGVAALALGFSASVASAATVCAATYQHPAKAKSVVASLTQAFLSCTAPNDTTETGTVPTCSPALTYNEGAGSPAGGWLWGPKSSGVIKFQAAKNKCNAPDCPLNPAGDSTDLKITVQMKDIQDENGPATSNGSVGTVARATIIDRAADVLMTVIDFPTGFGLPVSGGKTKTVTTATAILNGLSQPALPPCSNVEVVAVLVNDPNGNPFANIGTFLP
jgi:hypothetical protein